MAPSHVPMDAAELLGIIGAVPFPEAGASARPAPAAVEVGLPFAHTGPDGYTAWHGGYQGQSLLRQKPSIPQKLRTKLRKPICVDFAPPPACHLVPQNSGNITERRRPGTAPAARVRFPCSRPRTPVGDDVPSRVRSASRQATQRTYDLHYELEEAAGACAAMSSGMFEAMGVAQPPPRPRSAPAPNGQSCRRRQQRPLNYDMTAIETAAQGWASAATEVRRERTVPSRPSSPPSSLQTPPSSPQKSSMLERSPLLQSVDRGTSSPMPRLLSLRSAQHDEDGDSDGDDVESRSNASAMRAAPVPMGHQVSLRGRMKGERITDSGASRNEEKMQRAVRRIGGVEGKAVERMPSEAKRQGDLTMDRKKSEPQYLHTQKMNSIKAANVKSANKRRGKAIDGLACIMKGQLSSMALGSNRAHEGDGESSGSSDDAEDPFPVSDNFARRQTSGTDSAYASKRGGNRRGALVVSSELVCNVSIIGAAGLRAMDVGGTSDAYCTCELAKKPSTRVKTAVKKMTLNPVWDEHFVMPFFEKGDVIVFTVYDQDLDKDEVLGKANLPYSKFSGYEGFSGNWPIYSKQGKAGNLRIGVKLADTMQAKVGIHSELAESLAKFF